MANVDRGANGTEAALPTWQSLRRAQASWQGRSSRCSASAEPENAMSEEDPDRERRLQFFREHFLPADVRANWIRISRRMIAKAIRRRWKLEARERRLMASRRAF